MATPSPRKVYKISWSYLCRKAKLANVTSLSITLDKKERVEIFLEARPEVQHFILSDLPNDITKKLLETATTFEDGMETFYYITHINSPSLSTTRIEAAAAVKRLKKICSSLQFNASGKFVVKKTTPSRCVYFYEFENTLTAISLKHRTPPFFPFTEEIVQTDAILPHTNSHHLELDHIVTKRSKLNTDQVETESDELFSVLGEAAKTNLICHEFSKVMKANQFVVQTNKSLMIAGHGASHSSVCATSKPDLICFNYNKSFMVVIDIVDKDVEYGENFIGEAEQKGVKGIKIMDKDTDENTFQQLMGGVEKGIGDASILQVEQNINDPMFTLIEIYAISVYHKRNEGIIRKVTVDFEGGQTTIQRGMNSLTIQDAFNRLSEILLS